MGLSDDERTNGIIGAACSLYNLRGFKASEHCPLNKLLEQVWPALIASRGNGLLWIMGSELASDHFSASSAVKAAFHHVLGDFRVKGEDSTVTVSELRDEMPESPYKELCKYLDTYKPDMHHFLDAAYCYGAARCKHELTDVLKVYLTCESFMYFANRYSDDFARRCSKARNLIAKIMGFCLDRFASDPQYLAAYMSGNIFDRILQYDVEDTVTMWFRDDNLHHDVKMVCVPNNEIKKIFREVRQGPVPSSQRRMEIILKFVGNGFHYEHQHKKLLKSIEEHNKRHKNDQINTELIKKLCVEKFQGHAKQEKESAENYRPYDSLFCEEIKKEHVQKATPKLPNPEPKARKKKK